MPAELKHYGGVMRAKFMCYMPDKTEFEVEYIYALSASPSS